VKILENEPMKNHTTFKVGGPADFFVTPADADELISVLKSCRDGGLPYFILGNGSNLLVGDDGIRGTVISLKDLCSIQLVGNDLIYAQAGCLLSTISKFACEHSLSGMEFAEGIPGSLGGGIIMNAGAYGDEVKDAFHSAQVIDKDSRLLEIDLASMDFSYRTSAAQINGYIICGATLRLAKGNQTDIAVKMADYRHRRTDKQPLNLPSAGSTFKRPPGHFAGKLIMDAGLAGFSIGGAQVSKKHCGFIVNTGNATAADILALISHVQRIVNEKFDVMLEVEVKIIGE